MLRAVRTGNPVGADQWEIPVEPATGATGATGKCTRAVRPRTTRRNVTSSHQMNLADLFEVVADTVPDRLALVAGPDRLTYRELDERANRFGHYLRDQGIAPGAHVGILAHNRAEWAETMIGCYKARAVPININYRYVAPELRYVIDNADLAVLVYERELTPLVDASLDDRRARSLHLAVIEDDSDISGASDAAGATDAATPYEAALASARATREFGSRSPDDLY